MHKTEGIKYIYTLKAPDMEFTKFLQTLSDNSILISFEDLLIPRFELEMLKARDEYNQFQKYHQEQKNLEIQIIKGTQTILNEENTDFPAEIHV